MEQRLIADRYALAERLGSSTWRATDTDLERDVVVRLGAGEPSATVLSHPSIAPVFDHGEADGERYVVREYLPGGSLAERRAALSELEAHDAGHDVAAALAHAHALGVTHGALSEATVLFDAQGRAKVADFTGAGEPEEDVRALGAILRTLAAAAPALAAPAAAALAGDTDAAALAERLDDVRPTAPPPKPTMDIEAPPRSHRSAALLLAGGVALLAAGLGAAFIATSGGADTDEPTVATTSLPTTTASTSTAQETAPPPPPPAPEPTTDAKTTARTTTTAPTTTAPRPTTAPPPPTTTPPPPPPPTETDEPPPTETEPPPPTTTAPEPPPTTTG